MTPVTNPPPETPPPIPPELIEWAKQTFDQREYAEGVREIEATGGVPLSSFIADVEARVRRQ